MAHRIEDQLTAIEQIVADQANPITAKEIAEKLGTSIRLRTLQYRLKLLVDEKRLERIGGKKDAAYRIRPPEGEGKPPLIAEQVPLSIDGRYISDYVGQALGNRRPVGYDRDVLDSYVPNSTFFLTNQERRRLMELGTSSDGNQPQGTYAKRILGRLLIDLSWNSSRLEGNTYSLLDTKRLLQFGEEAKGKAAVETQMILNHKDAIEFLVESAGEVGLNRHTLLNLHGLLANNLLQDPQSMGRLRHIPVGIEKSVFHPVEVPQVIDELFDLLLEKCAQIEDPFEQAFFLLFHVPYLQPFDDVNKRVSRLAANIPMIKFNLLPLSFTDVPRRLYSAAILGVYELSRHELLRDLFLWAYGRSVQKYRAVRQSLGTPDPFRLRHREVLRYAVNHAVTSRMGKSEVLSFIRKLAERNVGEEEYDVFSTMVENELVGLHEGNIARYRIRPSEFLKWKKIWDTDNEKAFIRRRDKIG